MLYHQLPLFDTNSTDQPSDRDLIIAARTNETYYMPEHYGSLGILYLSNGKGSFKINAKDYTLSGNNFLTVNLGSKIKINEISEGSEATFIFFNQAKLSAIQTLYSQNNILDLDIKTNSSSNLSIIERNYTDQNVIKIFSTLREMIGIADFSLEEWHLMLGEAFVKLSLFQQKELNNLKVKKKSSKEEIYRRLYLVKDMLDQHPEYNITIEEMAQKAFFNPYHFLRMFKQLYGVTPNKYIGQIKIEKAKMLLSKENDSVADICCKLGYESLGSFSAKFKKVTGLSPTQYRANHRIQIY